MSTIGMFAKNIGLAMAGKNPWGGKAGGSGADGSGESDGEDGGSGSGGNDGPKGPRNPWLPSGGGDEPRRSANIEDIFKNKGRGSGGGSGGPGFRMPERPGGKSWLPVAFGLIALVALTASMIHQVGPKEKAIVKTFGQYSSTLDSGFHVTLPWPATSVDIENVTEFKLVRIPDGEKELLILTGDQNLVNLSYLVRWSIDDLELYKFRLADPIGTVTEAAEAAMRAEVANKTLDETFSGEGRAQIEEGVRTRMQAVLDRYKAGVRVQGVEIEKSDPPSEVVDAFKDVSVAEQDADAAKNRAQGFAQQVLAAAEGETAAFDKVYEQYRLAPEVTRQRLYYETMERILSKTDKTVVESGGVQTYLPLPEIRKRAQQQPAAPAAPTSAEGQ